MADENSRAVALLKYPVTVFSILIALIIARFALGISFDELSSVGPGGVTFDRAARADIAGLEGRLNSAILEIQELKKRAPQVASSPEAQTEIFAASQTVSDQTAQLAKLPTDAGGSKQKGYVWIGNYNGRWRSAQLRDPTTGKPITEPPDQLQPGSEYTLSGNMVIRDGLPSNDAAYYRGRKSLGVLPRGTKVRLVNTPTGIDREFAMQYWAEVEPS